jgi:hypothetical protein
MTDDITDRIGTHHYRLTTTGEAMTQAIEDRFITRLGDRTLNMIEDENGDVFWGYDHQDAPEFIDQVNQYLIWECGVTDPDDLFAASQPVEHLWAKFDDEHGEHFTLREPVMRESDAELFPVTRLVF